MADAFGSTGMAAPGAPGTGSTFFSDPKVVQQLLKSLGGQQEQLGNFMQNPAGSQLFQGQLSGLLNALIPSEQRAMTQLSDIGREGGNTASSVYAGLVGQQQNDFLRNRQELASKLLGQSFNQITQALLGQMGLTPQLLNALKLSQQNSNKQQTNGWESIPPSQGLNTPMSSSFGGAGAPSYSYAQPAGYANNYDWNLQRLGLPSNYAGPTVSPEDRANYNLAQTGSTMFLPGGQMVGQSTPSNNAIFDQLTGGGNGGSTYYDQQGGDLTNPNIFQ